MRKIISIGLLLAFLMAGVGSGCTPKHSRYQKKTSSYKKKKKSGGIPCPIKDC